MATAISTTPSTTRPPSRATDRARGHPRGVRAARGSLSSAVRVYWPPSRGGARRAWMNHSRRLFSTWRRTTNPLRTELTAAGALNAAYHPRLEEVHRANASRLRQIIAVFGWPGMALVGERGAKAAWRIALHSISEPPFMRQCRDLIEVASQQGDVPRWQFAIIDDRIRVYEGRPQRYGTQLRTGPEGLRPPSARKRVPDQFDAHAGGIAPACEDPGAGACAAADRPPWTRRHVMLRSSSSDAPSAGSARIRRPRRDPRAATTPPAARCPHPGSRARTS